MRILAIIGLAVAVMLAGCSNTNTTASNTPKISNSDLEQAVKTKLATDQRLQDSKIDVSADADKNQVTLSGTVYTENARTNAVQLTKLAEPGLQVVDKIEVKPGDIPKSAYTQEMAREEREKAKSSGDKIGNSVEDAWIHTKISTKLIADSSTPARKISIDVVNGVVSLRGTVDNNEAKQQAGRIAMETDGVKHVNNLLKVTAG
jgi:osmotically-inducible protein OsmY